MRLATRIQERTPEGRDRYLDFLRVTSILFVVVGHWLVRAVTVDEGRLEPGYMLALQPWTQYLTLIVQVLPIFFLVGGALNADSWRRARRGGVRATDWLRKRARRLLRPVIPLLLLWISVAALIDELTWRDLFVFGADTAVTPIWFLAAYLVVTALTPATVWMYERAGALAPIVAATAAAVVVDWLRFHVLAEGPLIEGQPAVGGFNFVIVIIVLHQLGYLWADDRLPRHRGGQALLAVCAAAVLALMIGSGVYPLTMVPVSGTDLPNNLAPPSAALIALGLVQLGLALLARQAMNRWLARPRPWAAVAIPGSNLMTVFLWHQTALLAVAAATYRTGLWPARETIDASWWAMRPLWVLSCGLVLTMLAAIFGRFESAAAPPPTRLSTRVAGIVHSLGVLFTSGALAWFAGIGLRDPTGPLGLPVIPLAALLVGLAALGVLSRREAASGGGRT